MMAAGQGPIPPISAISTAMAVRARARGAPKPFIKLPHHPGRSPLCVRSADLDALVCNSCDENGNNCQPNQLFLNDGNGAFTEDKDSAIAENTYTTYECIIGDVNGDGGAHGSARSSARGCASPAPALRRRLGLP